MACASFVGQGVALEQPPAHGGRRQRDDDVVDRVAERVLERAHVVERELPEREAPVGRDRAVERVARRGSVTFGSVDGIERSARSGWRERPSIPRPSSSRFPGIRDRLGGAAAGGTSRPSGLGSSRTLRISLPETPSATA